jgi:alkylation response protein AidB-like acyl-CoA dehydrogenase
VTDVNDASAASAAGVDFTQFHDELRSVARQLLSSEADRAEPFVLGPSETAASGWLGLEVPDSLGGAGATFAETAIVMEELGRACAWSGFVGTGVLAVGLLSVVETSPVRDRLLSLIAAGDVSLSVALPTADEEDDEIPFALASGDSLDSWTLTGSAPWVLDAPGSDRLLIPARSDGGVVVVEVDTKGPGLTVVDRPVVDRTRQLGSVTAESAPVGQGSVFRFMGDPWECVCRIRDRAAMATACDSLGMAEAMLEATVAYASAREQFGRPIGSFQAVQHACADMVVQVSMSRALVANGVRCVAVDDPGAPVAVSMAKSYVCAAAVAVAGKAMQLHGGIGYTWESGVHAFLKRAALNRSLFGSPTHHRRRLGRRYLRAGAGPGADRADVDTDAGTDAGAGAGAAAAVSAAPRPTS